jgi:hypothetical protein
MSSSDTIRHAIAAVNDHRALAAQNPALHQAVQAVKAFQAARFRATYADLLANPRFRPAVLFFLNELYGDKDYTLRDAQFVRIASPLERLFPHSVVDTAVAMAELHAVTEQLDTALAHACLALVPGNIITAPLDTRLYVQAWQRTGQRAERDFQLATVLRVGQDLSDFTRKRGLRTLLRMMRGPAKASGMGALQIFLEAGFDTFGELSTQGDAAQAFLAHVAERENRLIETLFTASVDKGVQALGGAD